MGLLKTHSLKQRKLFLYVYNCSISMMTMIYLPSNKILYFFGVEYLFCFS